MKFNLTFFLALLLLALCFLPSIIYAVEDCSVHDGSCFDCQDAYTNSCVWCPQFKKCYNYSALVDNVESGTVSCQFCAGGSCDYVCDGHGFFPTARWVSGEIILLIFYGFTLAIGAKIMADGSELLLEILDPGIIGGLLLPILGAVPDTAIVVVSGAIGSKASAQNQLTVGMGTLAGSTVMLLTLPWVACLWLARTDIKNGVSVDKVLTNPWTLGALTKTGCTVDDDTKKNARIMVVSSVLYLIVQIPSFKYLHNKDSSSAKNTEKWASLVGFILCFIGLALYCGYQVYWPSLQKKQMAAARRTHAARQFLHKMESLSRQAEDAPELSVHNSDTVDLKAVGEKWKQKAEAQKKAREDAAGENGGANDEESEEDTPQSKKKIIIKACILLTIGTAIVTVFSDPMVEVVTDFGNSIHVKAFFVSFIITPFCSNASEIISSLIFAMKKMKTNNSLVYAQLYGAATVNNTLVLGVFYALIFFRGLAWEFTAEVISILVTVLIVGAVGSLKTTYYLWYSVLILCYPGTILFVALVESLTYVT